MHVESVYPNGDVAVDVSGQGTVVLRINGAGGGAPGNTGLPTIGGSTQQGQTLSASPGSWSNSPTSFAYQWRRCDASGNACLDIQTGGTGSAARAPGSRRRIDPARDRRRDEQQRHELRERSSATGVVTGSTSVSRPSTPPRRRSAAPPSRARRFDGASAGSWSNSPTSFAYQWRRCSRAQAPAAADIASAGRRRATPSRQPTSAPRSACASQRGEQRRRHRCQLGGDAARAAVGR